MTDPETVQTLAQGNRETWRELAQQVRVDSVHASSARGSDHPTSSMSAADLMAVLTQQGPALRLRRPGEPEQR